MSDKGRLAPREVGFEDLCCRWGEKPRSEVGGGHLVGVADGFDAVGAVLQGDVAESTFLGAGNEPGGSGAAMRRMISLRFRTKLWSMPPCGTRSVRSL